MEWLRKRDILDNLLNASSMIGATNETLELEYVFDLLHSYIKDPSLVEV